MTDILTPPNSHLSSHFMCSQSGNFQDLASAPGHSPSCILESDIGPDSSTRQDLHSLPPLPSDMGMRYMLTASDDVRSNQEFGTHSPVYIEPALHHNSSSPSSTISTSYLPYSGHLYQQPSLSGSTYSSSGSSFFSPNSSIFSMPDIKPRLSSLHSSPGMAPPSRSPALPHPTSPINTIREIYTSNTPHHLRRTSDALALGSRSPSASGIARGVPLSPTSSGFTSPTMGDSSQASPPLHATEVIHRLQTPDGQVINPEIYGRIDKGFFMADNDWTCYRRNYFSLNASYTLLPAVPSGTLHLPQHGGNLQVYGFAISIAAVVDGRDGKPIELVQHTPKRDKGPQDKPPRVPLSPRPPPSTIGIYGGDGHGGRGLYAEGFSGSPGQPTTEATFERIQFKNATANNGKRRAAQQYYHLLVELFADVGAQHPDRYIKIATRMSAPMVVRGRSPGHYQGERRGSNASAGGSGGAGGAGSYTPGGNPSRTPGDLSMPGSSSMLPSSSYGTSYDGHAHQQHYYRSSITPLQIPMEPTLSAEEAKRIEEDPNYLYYPGSIYEGHEGTRHALPSVNEYTGPKIKQEFASPSGFVLPSLASTQDFGRHCGRWEGTTESKGYFPTALIQQELNIT